MHTQPAFLGVVALVVLVAPVSADDHAANAPSTNVLTLGVGLAWAPSGELENPDRTGANTVGFTETRAIDLLALGLDVEMAWTVAPSARLGVTLKTTWWAGRTQLERDATPPFDEDYRQGPALLALLGPSVTWVGLGTPELSATLGYGYVLFDAPLIDMHPEGEGGDAMHGVGGYGGIAHDLSGVIALQLDALVAWAAGGDSQMITDAEQVFVSPRVTLRFFLL